MPISTNQKGKNKKAEKGKFWPNGRLGREAVQETIFLLKLQEADNGFFKSGLLAFKTLISDIPCENDVEANAEKSP